MNPPCQAPFRHPSRAVNRIWSRRWYFESRRLWGPKAPTQTRGLGVADAPSRVQGQSPVGGPGGESSRKQNEFNVWHCQKLTFLIFTQYVLKWMADKIPEKIVGTPTPKKILKSRVMQMPFPAFSRGISWGGSRISWRGVGINGRQRRWPLGGSGGMVPRKIFNFRASELRFPEFPGVIWSGLAELVHFFNHAFVILYVFTFSLGGSTEPPEPPLDPPQISHQRDNHNWEQKTFIKSTFAVSSSCSC